MDCSGKYNFVRYNLDKFIDKHNASKHPLTKKKMDLLENNIDKHIIRIGNGLNIELIEIHHVFHNEN